MSSLFLLLWFSVPYAAFAQALNFDQTNYTIEDGLPSNECHELLQDSLGYIWIATDRGLVRYDGYEFKTYGIQEGLEDLSCLDIAMDEIGYIWVLTLSGRVYSYDTDGDEILPYQHQSILDSFLRITKMFTFDVSECNTLSFVLEGIGIIDISEDGQSELYREEQRDSLLLFFTKTTGSGILTANNTRLGPPNYKERHDLRRIDEDNYISEDYEVHHNNLRVKGVFSKEANLRNNDAFLLPEGMVLLANGGVDYYFERDTVLIRMHQNEFEDLTIVNDTSIITCEVNQKGVSFYKNYSDLLYDQKETLIQGVSATCSLIDQDHNIWVTTTDQGLFKLERKLINSQVSTVATNRKVTNIEQGHSTIYFVLEKNALYKRTQHNTDSLVLFDRSDCLYSLGFDKYKNDLIICNLLSELYTEENNFSPILFFNYKFRAAVVPAAIHKAFVLAKEEYVTTKVNSIQVYTDLDSLQEYNSEESEDVLRVLGVARISAGHYLLGTVNGLLEFNDQIIQELDNRPKLLETRINDIKKLGDKYLFATMGNGLVVWDLKDELSMKAKSEGLLSDNIEQIFIDKKEHIYLSTKAGLGKLWYDDNDSLHIKNYTTFHGLPSNEVNDVTEWNDTIYLATGKGIAMLTEDLEVAPKHQVLLEDVLMAGDSSLVDLDDISLAYNDNNLSIHYKTIDYTMKSKIDYRYRLNEGPWTVTRSTFASFSALQPDTYLYEVQSKNRDDIWSESTTLSFTIDLPWWKTWWCYFLSFCLVILLGFYIYKRRISFLKNKIKVEREIRELERSALQAQMNPHFIFNCLNSIQRFIMDNDKENAMEYLAKFATLIRQSLNASNEKKISLDQEILMLQNYLDLEKLRFKKKFDYKIILDEAVVPEEISIPPLLVQPYVENAIIHGMQGLEVGGLIEIHIKKINPNRIEICIRDNGKAKSYGIKNPEHKSLGMSITSRRLAHNNQLADDSILIEPSYSEEGAEVVITVSI